MNPLKSIGAVLLLALACGPIAPQPCGTREVDVTVSSVTLGDQCAAGAKAEGLWQGDCATDGCGLCRASSVQLDIVSRSHQNSSFTVREVRLYDVQTGALVETLYPSGPTRWDGSQYSAWDEIVPSLKNLKSKYTLTAPDWSKINSGRYSGPQSYNTQVDVEIDGRLETLTGPTAHREPEVAT